MTYNDIFIKDVERRLEKCNKFILYINVDDIRRLLCIIEGLESENEIKTKCIKELEELNKSVAKSYIIYSEGDVILNANNDND